MHEQSIFFWQKWKLAHRSLYWLALSLFSLTLLGLAVVYMADINLTIGWSSQMELNSLSQPIGEVVKGPFDLEVEGKLYILEELFQPTTTQINAQANNIYGALILLPLLILLAVMPGLSTLYFAAGMTVFVFFLSFLKLDYLDISKGNPQLPLLITFLTYLPLAVIFHYYRKKINVWWRLLGFTTITVLLLLLLPTISPLRLPALHLVHYGSLALIALSLLFILITAQEILSFFLQILLRYNPKGSYQNLLHFVVLSAIYLGNLIFLHLKRTGEFVLDIYYIDEFLLFFISATLGIWGYARRQSLTSKWLPFQPIGALVYLTLGTITFLTINFAWLNDNSSWKDVFADAIVYSYIAVGIAFFLMVSLNFAPLMRRSLKVNTDPIELYRGKYFPINLARFATFVVLFAIFSNNRQMLYYQSIAGYYNSVGDFYYQQEDLKMAKAHYEAAINSDYYSPRLQYTLADIVQRNGNVDSMRLHLKDALFRQNSPFVYARLANHYYESEQDFDPLFTIREANKLFPNSIQIHNNLAYFYAQNNVLDSAIYHFEQAQNTWWNAVPVPHNNFWAMLARNQIEGFRPDSLAAPPQLEQNLIGYANYFAAFGRYQSNFSKPVDNLPKVKEANPASFAYIYNYAHNRLGQVDTLLEQKIADYQKQDSTLIFGHKITFMRAAYDYYRGKSAEGIRLLAGIPTIKSNPYFNKVIGLWLLEQEAYGTAITYLDKAAELGETNGIYYKAVLLSEAGQFEPARKIWQTLLKSSDKKQKKMAKMMLNILQDSVDLGNDQEKFAFIHYQRKRLPIPILQKVFREISEAEAKHRAAASLIDALLQRNALSEALSIYQEVKVDTKVSRFARSALNEMYLKLLLIQKKYDELLSEIDNLQMVGFHQNIKPYYRAKALEYKKDYKNAETYYLRAKESRPFAEEVLLSVANFLQKRRQKPQEAYRVLAESLRLNPYSLGIYKAYALQSIEAGLEYYGEDALEEIQKMTTPEDYEAFVKQFEEAKASYKARILKQ